MENPASPDSPDPLADPPRWFRTAMAERPEHAGVEVAGASIHLRAWGERGLPGIVLVHGGAAHSGWWDHVAPFFSRGYRVVALDLSGHGDSDHRPVYDLDLWAREVLAAAGAAGTAGPPMVVGHSMGGWVAATVGARYGAEVGGVVIVDSPLNDQPPEEARLRLRNRQAKLYPTREELLSRFRAMPPQELELPWVLRHIAEESVRETAGGWRWKFDPGMFDERVLLRELLPELKCRAGFLRSEFGLVPPSMAAEIDALLGRRVPIVELPASGHHPMLDQPLVLVTALRALLRQWAVDDAEA